MSWVEESRSEVEEWWGEDLKTLPLFIWWLNVGIFHLEALFSSWAFWDMWETVIATAVEERKIPMMIVYAGDLGIGKEVCIVPNQGFAETMSKYFGNVIETCCLVKKKDHDLINMFLLDDMLKINREEFVGL